jgi:gluconolactonase
MPVEIRDERFKSVVGSDVSLKKLATGFEFTEGPIWNAVTHELIFSDMPGDIMRRWTPGSGVTTFRKPSNKANGNYYDREGRLVTCEHASSSVTRIEHDGSITVLASHYDGKELNSPNDLVVKSDGAIYFSDPDFGRREYYGVKREKELSFNGVYRLDPGSGDLTLLAADFGQPNGLCFSRDESLLFINDSDRGHIRVFEVNPDGTLSNGRVWADVTGDGDGVPDGMKLDSGSNIYCAGPGGIHVFAPDAACLGVIRFPEVVANFCFGGDDLRTLFVTASTSIYGVRIQVPGNRVY